VKNEYNKPALKRHFERYWTSYAIARRLKHTKFRQFIIFFNDSAQKNPRKLHDIQFAKNLLNKFG